MVDPDIDEVTIMLPEDKIQVNQFSSLVLFPKSKVKLLKSCESFFILKKTREKIYIYQL